MKLNENIITTVFQVNVGGDYNKEQNNELLTQNNYITMNTIIGEYDLKSLRATLVVK